jgi:hypothetical protein
MATNISGVVSMATVAGNTTRSDAAGNSAEMEHLKTSIDDVFILTSGITVCCE